MIIKPKFGLDRVTLEQFIALVEQVGKEKSGIEGKITEKGMKKFKEALMKGLFISKVGIEVSCQIEGHQPFNAWWGNLRKRQWCRLCAAESRAYDYNYAVRIG
ncbi:MAG: hypothetical protein P8Y23_16735 [Candidatus Lokiarchaeota archaeon]